MAPAPGRFICPWARSRTPGYANGGAKFDLSRWDAAYFRRLKDFVAQASRRGVVVEVNLFCPFYRNEQWRLSPMNAANNVNRVGAVGRTRVYTLDKHGGLLPIQEAMVRKIVAELNRFDNVYYEVMNEPYIGHVPLNWQRHIADVIVQAEKGLPKKHLISRNVANRKAKIRSPHPAVSIFNFHYAFPPDAAAMNYRLNKVIGDNETGFCGVEDAHYRIEGWAFILAGGGLFNHLDYSFAAGYEDGTFAFPPTQPGGGGPTLRRQLRALKEFIESFDFVRMTPARSVIRRGLPEGVAAQALAEAGKQYALYFYRPARHPKRTRLKLTLDMPPGAYRIEWVDPKTGEVLKSLRVRRKSGAFVVSSPPFREDIALRILSTNE